MRCFWVEKDVDGKVTRGVREIEKEDFTQSESASGDLLIRVSHSSLNYKDALAAQANPGVVRQLPHIPGIDAAGVVESCESDAYRPGDDVLVTGYDLGGAHWGGWSEYVRIPNAWAVPMPAGLSAEDAMTLGTAGFTAAQCVDSLQRHEITPQRGPVVVTGATGGVGCLAVALLAHLNYQVIAVSGKVEKHPWLRELGASDVIGREAVDDQSGKPLLKAAWAGAIDTVGGNTLATLLRSLDHRGCVAACGLVGGTELPLTVYPFLLRGVTLDGIDSAQCPRGPRERIWQLLSSDWKLPVLDVVRRETSLDDLEGQIQAILAGEVSGRVIVRI